MESGDLQAVWAQVLMHGFADGGVTDVVISPGSRSTPLVLAAHHHPALACHDVIDERSAGFFALGQARVTQRPTLLVCTSGSAGAHYLPALVEARQAALPMLVLTADRPLELDRCGANQTIDQVKLFADHAVAFFDLGTANDQDLALRSLRRKAVQAVATSHGPVTGGVHLNARFRKPLEPAVSMTYPAPRATRLLERPLRIFAPAVPAASPAAIAELSARLAAARRPLVVAGPAPVTQHAAREPLARVLDAVAAPLFAEATSQLRFRAVADSSVTSDSRRAWAASGDSGSGSDARVHVDAFDVLLRTQAGPEMLPDLILQLGATPTAAAWLGYLAVAVEAGAWHVVVAEHGWHDAQSTASALVQAGIAETLSVLADSVLAKQPGDHDGRPGDGETTDPALADRQCWLRDWTQADAAVWRTIASGQHGGGARRDGGAGEEGVPLAEAKVVRSTACAVPARGLLAIGNSLPVRLLDTWVAGDSVDASVSVVHQRGASGIDGLVSGAAGAALASGRPTALLLGDVSMLHDLGGLAVAGEAAARAGVPLVVVIINNGGGRIFDLLPVAHHPSAEGAFTHWRTPHDTDFAHAAKTFGVGFERCHDVGTLERSLARSWTTPGVRVIEAVVVPGHAQEALAALRRAVADEVCDG